MSARSSSVMILACGLALPACQRPGERSSPAAMATAPAPAGAGSPLFIDVSHAAGVDFRLVNGATAEHYLVETMLGGLGFIDYDNDGDPDLYVANGHSDSLRAAAPGDAKDRLYRNDGGTFHDVTAEAGVDERRYSDGVAVGDYDNDGWPDLLVTNFGRNTLFHNEHGTLRDVTVEAGLVEEGWNTSAAWFDLDRDGDLDLYIARYLEYQPATARPCRSGERHVYCHPHLFYGQRDLLYENRGGRFQEIGERAGIARSGPNEAKGLGVIAVDLDDDGWQDVYVANDSTPSFLWHSNRDGTFQESALTLAIAVGESGKPQAGMGIDWGDVDGDGRMDLHKTNLSGETNNLYLARAAGGFIDAVQSSNLGATSATLGFGTLLADFDLDGDLDIVVANGHVDDGDEHYAQRPALYLNRGAGRFSDDPALGGPVFSERMVARGLASADIDGDGDLDLAMSTLDRGVVLLRNEAQRTKRATMLKLVGTKSPRDGTGARLHVTVAGVTAVRDYASARSYLSASDPRIPVALGAATRIEKIRVRWASGTVQELTDVAAEREIVITEP